jgi:hypothetical protein
MDTKLSIKGDSRLVLRILAGMGAFALTLASVFGLMDMVREGKLRTILRLTMTPDGRVYFIVAGLVGFAAACVLFVKLRER